MKWPFNLEPSAFRRNKIDITGWEPSAAEEILRTERAAAATLLRIDQRKVKNQPSAIKGELLLTPEAAAITLDARQTGAPLAYNFIVRSGQQYDISIPYNAPGVFLAREMHCVVHHRQFQATSGTVQPFVQWRALQTGSVLYAAAGATGDQTVKIADTVTDTTGGVLDRRFCNYFWNLEDVRSGRRYADDLVSHLHLRPQSTINVSESPAENAAMMGTGLRFPVPWMVGPGGQLVFNFRPINDVVQLATTAGGQPYTNDQEFGTRNNAVRIRVELHGTRYFFGENNEDTMRRMRGNV